MTEAMAVTTLGAAPGAVSLGTPLAIAASANVPASDSMGPVAKKKGKKRGPGRPPSDDPKATTIGVRLTDDELGRLDAARADSEPRATALRRLAFRGKASSPSARISDVMDEVERAIDAAKALEENPTANEDDRKAAAFIRKLLGWPYVVARQVAQVGGAETAVLSRVPYAIDALNKLLAEVRGERDGKAARGKK